VNSNGYPDRRFSFTGSPVAEEEPMETDTATAGSLHKVRRLYRNDDVVAASGHHFNSHRKQQRLTVDTQGDVAMMMDDDYDDESPTDVAQFPGPAPTPAKKALPPPTPVKARPAHYPGGRTPSPPCLERRGRHSGAARTPHLHPRSGATVATTTTTWESQQAPTATKSRFYADFDVIGELGRGTFGVVYKVLSRLDGCMYAIKAAQRQARGTSDKDRMLKEVRTV
jgi:hypothetical protein